jgi:hypothetical protein
MKEKRQERGEEVKKVRFAGDEEEYGEELSDDSEELMYDSEEEANLEQEAFLEKFAKEQMAKKDEAKAESSGYDIGKELAMMQRFKAAPGVNFVQYDEYGLPDTEEAKELRKYIKTDDAPDAIVIEAPPDQMERVLRPTGIRYDYDKPVDQMNEEGKSLKRPVIC